MNFHWLYEYHVDGFRYDEVTDLYDGPTGVEYAKIAYDTYNESLKIARFTPSGGVTPGEYSRIIQCPEALNRPPRKFSEAHTPTHLAGWATEQAERHGAGNDVDGKFVPQLLLDTRFLGYPSTKDRE